MSEKGLNVACLQAVSKNRKEKEVVLFLTVVDSEALDDFSSFQLTCRRSCIETGSQKFELHSMQKKR